MNKVKEMFSSHDSNDTTRSSSTSHHNTTGDGLTGNGTTGRTGLDGEQQHARHGMTTGTGSSSLTDRDGDGIPDSQERHTGSSLPGVGHHSSRDRDGDGIPDNQERGVNSRTTGSSLPAVGHNSGRHEETAGNSRSVSGRTGDFTDPHKLGHDNSIANKFDPTTATHDHKHLAHVTHRDHREVEVEEVERQKEHERHIHHVQHHVQPVVDKQVNDEVHHENIVPKTTIREQHVNTDEDRKLFSGLAGQHQDTESHRQKERTIVDKGEVVHENVQHHVHHITQPVVEQEVVDRHRIHTIIPTHHVTHEAPIVHKSSVHSPVAMSDFLQGGGKLGSGITHNDAGVLQNGECERSVDGVGETLAQKLHLTSGTTNNQVEGGTRI